MKELKKRVIRAIALVMVMVSILCAVPITASAAGSYTVTGTTAGGFSKYYYVKTGTTAASKKVTFTMTYGAIENKKNVLEAAAFVYGAYEMKVSYWNASTKKWVQEADYDVYNKSSNSYTCKKANTYYRIQIYSWQVNTIFNSYWKNNVTCQAGKRFRNVLKQSISPRWCPDALPKCTIKSGGTLYSSNPV